MKKRRQLGDATAKHRDRALLAVGGAETHTKLAAKGTCGIRLTSLVAAHEEIGRAFEQAFRSGGKRVKGAYGTKTVSDSEAHRLYSANDNLQKVTQAFRQTCIIGSK